MFKRITQWGAPTFLLAILVLAGCLLLSFRFSVGSYPDFYQNILPQVSGGLSLLLILLCQIAYWRIQNFEIYIVGIVLGVQGLWENAMKLKFLPDWVPAPQFDWAMVCLSISVILVTILPASLKYSTVKKITAGLIFILMAGNFLPDSFLQSHLPFANTFLSSGLSTYPLLAYSLPIFVISFTFFLKNNEFYLGGILSGLVVLISSLWLKGEFLADTNTYFQLTSNGIILFMVLGTVLHWIAKVSHNIAIDPLMQIYNRSYCNNIIREQSTVNTSPPLSVIMVDIDHFKKVNDVHGHQAGDTVLKKVAQTLKGSLGSNGVICRYGGEEIIIFISRTSQKKAQAIIEKARVDIKKLRVKVGKKSLKVTISAGISQRVKKNQSIESVISAADKAVYKAKKAGRDRVHTVAVYSRAKK